MVNGTREYQIKGKFICFIFKFILLSHLPFLFPFLFFSFFFFYIYIILISSHFTNLGTNGSLLKVKINSAETLAFRDDGTDVKLSPKELGSEKLLTLLQ